MASHPRGILRAALRGLAGPRADADAELLGRHVASRDEEAFAELVRRYGPMVHAVCRRRLGPGADCDDAFQVTFMVLARDAAKIVHRESVPGWLFRVATLAGLKLAGRNARRPAGRLPASLAGRDGDPAAAAAGKELRDALELEIAALPDKLRAVVVLCGLEEKTNAEAAALLGCPTGTIDSRLSAARKALKARLARRGLAVGAAAALDALGRADAGAVPAELIETTTRAAVLYATGRASANPLTPLADGVTPTMGTIHLKLLVTVGMSLALFGTVGAGLFHAAAQERPAPKPGSPTAATDPPAKPDPAPPADGSTSLSAPKDEAAVRAILDRPLNVRGIETLDFQTFLNQVTAETGLPVWIDYAAFKRTWGPNNLDDFKPTDRRVGRFPLDTSSLSLGELLTQALATAMPDAAYRVQGNRVVIVPAYQSTTLPDGSGTVEPQIPFGLALEQAAGPPVSVGFREQTLPDALASLRRRTGANIVLDPKAAEAAQAKVTASFDDVRLLTVLTVLAEGAGLEVVALDNVFFLTTSDTAAKLRERQKRATVPVGARPSEKPANPK